MTIPQEIVFAAEEFAVRRNNVRKQMSATGIDTLILHSAPNIYYLSGHHTLNIWDYQCLILPLQGLPVMVLWQFERGRFEASAVSTELYLYETHADPIFETIKALRQFNLLSGIIAIEYESRYLTPHLRDLLRHALDSIMTVNGSRIVDQVRNIKSEAELEVMRRAARITDDAVTVGYSAIRPGVSDSDVAADVAAELIRNDSLGFSVYPIISAGYRAGIPHNSNCGYRIAEGDAVFIECSPSLHWYHAPLMRTAAVGQVSKEIEQFASLEQEIVAAVLDAVQPGALASDIAKTAETMIAPVRNRILFHEVYGYPVGIGFPPTWGEESGFGIVVNNHRPLEAGMVFHIPMTLRMNGQFGVGLSQTYAVTESGCEVLSKLPLELHRVAV